MPTLRPLTSDLLVNTTTVGHQMRPSVTGLDDGGFVVTWMDLSLSANDNTAGWVVCGQVFSASGTKEGSEFLVIATPQSFPTAPSVTGLANGGFVVTWEDYTWSSDDPNGWDVRGQMFSASGEKEGSEFVVNTITEKSQLKSSVTGLSNGGFVVTWQDDSPSSDDPSVLAVRGQVFTASGAKEGSEFLVNTTTESAQAEPSVAGLSNGGFVVTWEDHSQSSDDPSDSAVRGQVFTASGDKAGSEFLVNTRTLRDQTFPSVTGLSTGGFVVTWEDHSRSSGDTSFQAVRGQVFTASGDKEGSEFVVNTTTEEAQLAPSVTGLSNGGFVVTWEDGSQSSDDPSGVAVRGQVFTASGEKEGSEFLVNATAAGDQWKPSVAGLADGSFVVSWQGNGPSDSSGVFARVFSYSMAPEATPGAGSTFTEDAGPVALAPDLTVVDADSTTLTKAVVQITAGLNAAQDVLAYTPGTADVGDITAATYDASTGTLVLNSTSGTATLAQWQAALRAVTYENSSQAPTTADRTISFTLSDAQGAGAPTTTTVAVTAVNDAPTTSPVTLADLAEDSGARLITQAELLAHASDVDSPTLVASDLVIASGQGTLLDNQDGSWTFTPGANDDTGVSFSYRISDGTDAVTGTASLDLTPVNDAPVFIDFPGTPGSATVGRPISLPSIEVQDVDGDTVPLMLTLTAAGGRLSGQTDADSAAPGIQLSGTAAQINAALTAARFTASAAGNATIQFSLSDQVEPLPTLATYTVAVSPVPQPPAPLAPAPATPHIDWVRYAGDRDDYVLQRSGVGDWSIRTATGSSATPLPGIERVVFDDGALALDLAGGALGSSAAQAARLVFSLWGQAGLDNPALMGEALTYVDALQLDPVTQVADSLGLLAALAGHAEPAALLSLLHTNIVGRAPDAAELQALLDFQKAGGHSNAQLVQIAAELATTAQAMDLSALIQEGLTFTPYVGPVFGSAGHEVFRAQQGDDTFAAGPGLDTVVYGGEAADYQWSRDAQGHWSVRSDAQDGGRDLLQGVERLQFADHAVALDLDGAAGQAARLLAAAKGADALEDRALLGELIAYVDAVGAQALAREVQHNGVLDALVGGDSLQALVTLLYQNVAGHAPSELEMHQVLELAAEQQWDRADVLSFATQLPQTAQLIGLPELMVQGLAYDVWDT